MNRVKLEADPSIIETKLLLPELKNNGELSSLYPTKDNLDSNEDIPWKPVVPKAGFCVKCYTFEGDKVFLNICHTDKMPAPVTINEEELLEILESDGASQYRIPMSLGDLHIETDKSGNLCSVYDIAINTEFYNKVKTDNLFRTFFMTVTVEGLQQKYCTNINMKSENPYIILKNRKFLGTLQTHRIQQRPIKKGPKSLIEEILPTKLAKEIKLEKELNSLQLELHPTREKPEMVIASVHVKVLTAKDLQLDVGEDRIILNYPKKNLKIFDVFLPLNIDQNSCQAYFNTVTQVFKLYLPLLNKE